VTVLLPITADSVSEIKFAKWSIVNKVMRRTKSVPNFGPPCIETVNGFSITFDS